MMGPKALKIMEKCLLRNLWSFVVSMYGLGECIYHPTIALETGREPDRLVSKMRFLI